MMTHAEFLDRIIDDGILAARHDYNRPNDIRLSGAVAGFTSCRYMTPTELTALLVAARQNTLDHFQRNSETYWYHRCAEAEIEWVCNCLSAVLVQAGLSPIVPVTARAFMKAAEILNANFNTGPK